MASMSSTVSEPFFKASSRTRSTIEVTTVLVGFFRRRRLDDLRCWSFRNVRNFRRGLGVGHHHALFATAGPSLVVRPCGAATRVTSPYLLGFPCLCLAGILPGINDFRFFWARWSIETDASSSFSGRSSAGGVGGGWEVVEWSTPPT